MSRCIDPYSRRHRTASVQGTRTTCEPASITGSALFLLSTQSRLASYLTLDYRKLKVDRDHCCLAVSEQYPCFLVVTDFVLQPELLTNQVCRNGLSLAARQPLLRLDSGTHGVAVAEPPTSVSWDEAASTALSHSCCLQFWSQTVVPQLHLYLLHWR